jgi:predicted nuclease of predicted toxin-antitoxin system
MKILFDQGTPAPLRRALAKYEVSTAYEMGWAELTNGALLRAADAQFNVLITTDRSLRHQQNIAGLQLAILVLPTTNWLNIRLHEAQIVIAVDGLRAGDFVELDFS